MEELITRNKLPFNLDDLLYRRGIEDNRVEFKSAWDEYIKKAVVQSVCAYANDFFNLNGGYIILGVETENDQPIFPPRGLAEADIDRVQREINGACKGSISPEYIPLVFVESVQGKAIIIIWAPAGDNRPYEAPSRDSRTKTYWIRSGSATIEAQGDLRRQLLEQAAKIPFDDRRNLEATIEVLSPTLIKKFLADIRSRLADMELSSEEIYRKLRLVVKVNGHEVPRNVAILFFNDDPGNFFRGSHIEVVQFGDDAGGDLIEEKSFRGALPEQILSCLNYLDGLGGTLLKKIPGQAEVERTVPYPYEAMEEAIVNAVYHRSYESPPEPVKVYLYPDRMEITSYPGPVPGITAEHLQKGQAPPVPARNRRIGEFLKDLRLAEGRGTGIPKIRRKMQENGSPEARFEFDDERTFFRVILPVHPRYQVLHALREAAHLWAIGEKAKAVAHLERAFERQPGSGAMASQIIEYAFGLDKMELAQRVMEVFEKQTLKSEVAQPYLSMARLLIDRNRTKDALEILKRTPPLKTVTDIVEEAILRKRTGDFKAAHHLFAQAHSLNQDDPKIIQEFAQTKNKLAGKSFDRQIRKRLNKEAAELLRRAIQLSFDNPMRQAWCWYDLARTLEWLRSPKSEVEAAFLQARSLLPNEPQFREEHEKWQERNRATSN